MQPTSLRRKCYDVFTYLLCVFVYNDPISCISVALAHHRFCTHYTYITGYVKEQRERLRRRPAVSIKQLLLPRRSLPPAATLESYDQVVHHLRHPIHCGVLSRSNLLCILAAIIIERDSAAPAEAASVIIIVHSSSCFTSSSIESRLVKSSGR